MSLVEGVHFPLVASALGGSLTRVAPGDERLCRLAGAGRFAVWIKAYCFCTQLVVLPAVAAHKGTGIGPTRTARHALRPFTGLRNALAAAPLAAVTLPHVLPLLGVGSAGGDGGVGLREMPCVVACSSGLEALACSISSSGPSNLGRQVLGRHVACRRSRIEVQYLWIEVQHLRTAESWVRTIGAYALHHLFHWWRRNTAAEKLRVQDDADDAMR
jgi:hypothetical protein